MLFVRVLATRVDAQLLMSCAAINQEDIQERNQQVLRMSTIYSKAERVIGWLGPDENGGSRALKTLEALFRNVIHHPNNFEWVRRMPELFTMNGTYTTEKGLKHQSNDRLEQMLLFLRRPYWRRVWVVQELVLPLSVRLLCGGDFMDMPEPDAFNDSVNKLSKLPSQRPQSVPLNVWLRLNECFSGLRLLAGLRFQHSQRESQADRIWDGPSGFIRARRLLEFHKTSDPRDHVYGLLGMIDLDIVPDYGHSTTIADVYLIVARNCLKAEPYDILSLVGIRDRANCLTRLNSPSWVPDWRFPPPARNRLLRYPQSHAFPSNGGLKMQVIDRKWLRGSAVVWDTVSRTEGKTGWDLSEWDLAENIDIEKPGDVAYPSSISRFEAMVLLWLGDLDGSKASARELELEGELFRSYKTIFLANIANPWANKHGRNQLPKLIHLVCGPSGPKSVPVNHRETYVARSRQLRYDMTCFHTEKGYIGFGPLTTEAGDLVCVLEGHKAPVLLYACGSHYHLVGDCDVVGIMNGEILEAVTRGEAELTEIEVR